MNLTDWLTSRTEDAFRATLGLVDQVDGAALDWRPASGDNWMTTGQLLRHLETACGAVAQAFVTGDFASLMAGSEGMAEGDQPAATDVAAAKAAIEADRALMLEMIASAGEDDLANRATAAPWNPAPRALAAQLGECIDHLNSHKSQLFYYLKLRGKPVHTGDLWGIELPG